MFDDCSDAALLDGVGAASRAESAALAQRFAFISELDARRAVELVERLEVHAPESGGWLRFDVVRTDSRGRFSLGYRFKQPGAARYRFRALSLAEAAYPYLAGGSNVAAVRKR